MAWRIPRLLRSESGQRMGRVVARPLRTRVAVRDFIPVRQGVRGRRAVNAQRREFQ